MSTTNSDSSAFAVGLFCVSFLLITVPRTSDSILNKSGKSECLCLVPDLKRVTFSFSL